jgi:hypothetical protein
VVFFYILRTGPSMWYFSVITEILLKVVLNTSKIFIITKSMLSSLTNKYKKYCTYDL